MCKATTFDLEANDASLESPGPSPAPRRKPTFHLMSTKLEEGQAEEGQPLTPCARAPSPPAAVPGWKKWGALFIFALQSAGSVLLMRYSKLQHGPAYSNLAAVMFQELVKLGVSTVSRHTRPLTSLTRSTRSTPLHPLPRPPRALRSCSTPTSAAAWEPWSPPCAWTCVTTRWSGCSWPCRRCSTRCRM